MIVVVPHGPAGSIWTDSRDGKQPLESVIIKNLIPHVDETYRTISKREARWIEGFSVGGRGAAHMGFEYPELFGAVSILAGALMDGEFWPKLNGGANYRTVFADDREYFAKHHPSLLVEKNADFIREKTIVRNQARKVV